MKVICIAKEKAASKDPSLIDAAKNMCVGDIVTVVYENKKSYEFQEYPHPKQIIWFKENFIPLSDIDETEFKRNYNKQSV